MNIQLFLLIIQCYCITTFVISFHSLTKQRRFFSPKVTESSILSKQHISSSTTKLFGIPKLFRWLVDLYPPVVDNVGQDTLNVDNLYLDMNGIIHPCTHNNDGELVMLDEQQMFLRIFLYTDRIYKLVQPKRLFYLAVDGVAPRAKMNQQRARRYRAGKERELLLENYVEEHGSIPEQYRNNTFDSNCITPGTDFMHRLGIAFRRWIEYKMKTDEFWIRNGATEVIFSGCDIPGEGEHKIMDKIRLDQKTYPDYRQKHYKHCMYGLDADLIMLSLVTHESNFILLREKILRNNNGSPKRDVLSMNPEDFEILEVSSLRTMLSKFYHSVGSTTNTTANTAAASAVGRKVVKVEESGSGNSMNNMLKKAPIRPTVPVVTMLSKFTDMKVSLMQEDKNNNHNTTVTTNQNSSSLSLHNITQSSTTTTNNTPNNNTKAIDYTRIIDDFVFM